jgi:hypothetical protein
MKKFTFYFILCLSFSLTLKSQSLPMKIRQQAIEMADATVKGDYSLVYKYTYPRLVEFVGGEEKMKEVISKGMESLKSNGITIEKITIGEPEKIFVAGEELHCLVPEKMIMKINDGHLLVNSNLLAVSKDKGLNWYFVDCNMDKDRLLQLFPNFNSELKIPEKQKPIKY